MDFDLRDEIVKVVSLIPGIYGFSSIDFNNSQRKLSDRNYKNAIAWEKTTKGILVKIAIIVDLKINSKTICKEIISSVNNIFKKNKLKIDDVLIYVRGVR